MSQAILHSLNIGTLSAWLSVAGFGTVGVVVHPSQPSLPGINESAETQVFQNDIDLGDAPFTSDTGNPQAATQPIAESIPETLPAPPELPPLTDTPLPEIPDLPEPAAAPAPAAADTARETPARASSGAAPRASKPTRSGTGKPASSSSGNSSSAGANGSSTMSNAARLAAGRMPAPLYPSAARRSGQTGTVIVEFAVDNNGRVISAIAKSPSPWPLLNEEAVRTVRRWKFPPGGVMKLQRPIVFQLR
jgi:periplasmic protein TonB